jgi:hypothetical protein
MEHAELVFAEVGTGQYTGLTFELYIAPDDACVRGNALASGDDAADRRYEDEILSRLNDGDIWAWCTVECRAVYRGFSGSDYLGGCTYAGVSDFTAPGGYWDDMKAEAARRIHLEIAHTLSIVRHAQHLRRN